MVGDQSEARVLDHPDVIFLGSLGPHELYQEYAQALCVVVPSQTTEGFGLVAAEAACAGGVVVASAHSGLIEVCSDNVGFLVESDAPQEWAHLIDKIKQWPASKRLAYTCLLYTSPSPRDRG